MLSLKQANPKTIERRFIMLGLGLNVSHKKNQELLSKLVQTLVDTLPSVELPLRGGWRKRDNEKWEYVPTEILTWEDIANEI